MAEYSNENRGALFVNDRKTPGSNQPDRTGSLNVDGVDYFLDGWLKTSQSGAQFLSVSIKRKDKQATVAPRPAPAPSRAPAPASDSGFDDLDSDIPFATSSAYYDMTTSKRRRMGRADWSRA